MRLGQTSAIDFGARITGSFLGFIATIYFARVLGEVVLGQYALVLALVAWLGLAGKVGFSKALIKRMSEGRERDQFAIAGLLSITILTVILVTSVLTFRDHVNAYVGVPVAEFVAIILLCRHFNVYVNSVLKGTHLVHVSSLLTVNRQFSTAAAQILFVIIGFGLTGMLFGYAIGAVLTGVIGLRYITVRLRRPSTSHIRSLFDYAKYAVIGSMETKSFNNIDIAILGFFVSAGPIGIYSVAWTLSKFLDSFGGAIRNTLFPEMSKLATEGDVGEVSHLTEQALSYGGLLLIPGLIGSIVIGDRLMLIYGEGFVEGTLVLPILISAVLLFTYKKQLLNTLNAVDRPDLTFRANVVFIIANVLFNIVLIYLYGWIGAAIATAFAAGIVLVVSYTLLKSIVPFSIPLKEISRQWFASFIMAGFVYLARIAGETHWIASQNAIFVLLLVFIGGASYFFVLLGISQNFRTTVQNNLPTYFNYSR